MNREQEFRAWDKTNNKWLDFKYLAIDPDTGNLITAEDSGEFGYFDRVEYSLMQYTGIKDKNGVTNIYEGDIVLANSLHDKPVEIRWSDSRAGFIIFTPNIEYDLNHYGPTSGFEVLGNIHENPELLK